MRPSDFCLKLIGTLIVLDTVSYTVRSATDIGPQVFQGMMFLTMAISLIAALTSAIWGK